MHLLTYSGHVRGHISGEKGNNGNENENEDEKDKINRMSAFTLIVIPNLFMTINTVENETKIILVKYPYAKIIIIGLPGSPKTIWPTEIKLTPTLHSTAIQKILNFLYEEKRFFSDYEKKVGDGPEEPVFFLGFGTGVFCLLKYLTEKVPFLPWLVGRVRCVCAVNGVIRLTRY